MNVKEAKSFLKTRLDRTVINTYKKYGFSTNGLVSSNDWEVFAAILFDEVKKPYGSDLQNYEVKSAVCGNSFEYQYHKRSGPRKLEEDKKVKHLFITYSSDYKSISVWLMECSQLTQKFDSWAKGIQESYAQGKQRYRKNIPYGLVKEKAKLLFELVENE